MLVKSEAVDTFDKYQAAGGKSALSTKDAKAILKFIFPMLAPNKKMSSYNTGPKAMSRLEQFATDSGYKIIWGSEMERFVKDDKKMQQEEL